MLPIRRERVAVPSPKPLPSAIGFGNFFTDHAFVAEHDAERGWFDLRIAPRAGLTTGVGSGALQYGLSVFEGLKAHRAHGQLRLFRPDAHARRLSASARRLSMPEMDAATLVEGMRALVREDKDWFPEVAGGSLYLRPTLFADEEFLGVRPAARHTLVVLMSPVARYFTSGAGALRLWAEKEHVRAAPGGVGAVKTGGNYASSLLAGSRAKARGYDQVLWLDARERRFLEEAGTMNVFVRIGDTVITPPLDGTILAGITRDSCLALLREWGVPTEERRVSLDELDFASEIWGTGTAAVVAPIAELAWEEKTIRPGGGEMATRLRDALEDLFAGRAKDTRGWLLPAERERQGKETPSHGVGIV